GLGYYDAGQNGLVEQHAVGIWDSGQTLLTSALVPSGTATALIDAFRYVFTPEIILHPGSYVIGGTIGQNASDPSGQQATGLTSIPSITAGPDRYTEAGTYTTLSYPNLQWPLVNPYNGYFGPNFLVNNSPAGTGQTPEPSTFVLLAVPGMIAVWAARRRRLLG